MTQIYSFLAKCRRPAFSELKNSYLCKYEESSKKQQYFNHKQNYTPDGIVNLKAGNTQTPGHLVAVIVLTAAVAVLGIWLCAKVDKKSSKLLN